MARSERGPAHTRYAHSVLYKTPRAYRLMRHPALLFAALVACQTAGSLGLQGTQESQGNAADTAALYISFSTLQQGETRRIFARDDLDVRVYVNELTPQHRRDCRGEIVIYKVGMRPEPCCVGDANRLRVSPSSNHKKSPTRCGRLIRWA